MLHWYCKATYNLGQFFFPKATYNLGWKEYYTLKTKITDLIYFKDYLYLNSLEIKKI